MSNPFEQIDARLSNIETLLLEIKHNPKSNSDSKDPSNWLDLKELCAYLPDKPVKATVYGWVHNNLIPYNKGTKKLQFSKHDIDEWIKSGRKKTTSEIKLGVNTYLPKKK